MNFVHTDLTQQSRVAEAAAWCLRDMSLGTPAASDLQAVAAALVQSASKLQHLALMIENSKECTWP